MPRHAHRSAVPARRRVAPVAGGLLAAALAVPMIVAGIVSADEAPARPAALGEPAAASVRLPEHSRRLDPVLDQPKVALAEMRAEARAERIAELRAKREAARRAAEAAERRARLAAERKAEREAAREARRAEREASTAPFDFKIGSFNVLGSQHTAPGGDRQKFPPASVRTPAAANLVAKHGVDVLGTQELQADQLRGLQARSGMSAYPGFGWGEAETDNSILWDPGMFELVSGSRFIINFMGRPRPQPIVRLRHLATGRELYVVNTHPSAGEGQYAAERRNGQSVLVGIVNDLKASGLPVLVTGDMNDREAFYCNVVPAAGLAAPNGGSYSGGCQPPPQPLPVDWVVGSQVSWSAYWRDTTPVDQRISDHFFISAAAHVG